MKKILVSACLFGHQVRYDNGDVTSLDQKFLQWKEEGRLIPYCPEVFGGLPTPRPDSQRVGERILTGAGVDVTKEYQLGANQALKLAVDNDIAFAILKQDSPSCGTKYIYDGTFTDTKIEGEGLTAETLRKAGFKVFDEGEVEIATEYLHTVER